MPQLSKQLAFIESLVLPDLGRPLLRQPPPNPASSSDESAFVAGNSIVSFVSGLSLQNREDVLNSTLLMQMAADKRFDKTRQSKLWFKFYTEGLGKLGWTVSNSALQEYKPVQQSFTVDQIVLEILETVAGASGFAPILQRSFDSLRDKPEALQVFKENSSSGSISTFQIMPCSQTEEGDVAMLLNCMQMVKQINSREILFFTFKDSDVKIYRSAQMAVFNTKIYSHAREAVIEKLSNNANNFITRLEV